MKLHDIAREGFELRIRALSQATGRLYRITKNADGTLRIRRLD